MLYMFDTGIINLKNKYLTWKIVNFNSLPLMVGCEIRSPEFLYGFSRYTLVIWPRGKKGTEEWFGICLYKNSSSRGSNPVKFTITNSLRDIKTCTVECSENNIFMQEKFMEWSDFRALGSKITPNGCLTIVCIMGEETDEEYRSHNANIREDFSHPTKDPSTKSGLGDYHLLDPLSMPSSVKLRFIESQTSSYQVQESTPSTDNSFYSAPSVKDANETVSDSIETLNSDSKIPYTVTSKSTLLGSFTRGFSRASTTNKPDAKSDSTSESQSRFTNAQAENERISDNLNTNKVTKVGSVVAISSNSSSSSGKFGSCSSLQIECSENDEEDNLGRKNEAMQNTDASPSLHPCEDVVANLHWESNDILVKESLTSAIHFPLGLRIMCQHYKKLYLEGKDFDLRIIMAGREFKVHRSILKTRSPVFFRLLSEDSSENTANIISIDPFGPCDCSIFHDFLLYIYSGELEKLSLRNISGLYFAACKFERFELKEMCMEFLRMPLAIDTITDIFRFVRDESELLDIALIFLAKHLELIMTTDEWKQFITEERDRAIELNLKALQIGFKKTII